MLGGGSIKVTLPINVALLSNGVALCTSCPMGGDNGHLIFYIMGYWP